MILNLKEMLAAALKVPRTCGDDPAQALLSAGYDLSAPHLRG